MSWYPATKLNDKQYKYLKLIQNTIKVKDTEGQWIPYKLQPHQIEWHANDVAVLGADATSRVVTKSRNTSFTTSAVVSQLMAVPHYPDQIIPYVRLNKERAIDLIREEKQMVRQIEPIKLDDGSLYPFDPDQVYMGNAMSIEFPNGVIHRAFPATADASETIRGLRLRGAAGIIDEGNFMRNFENVYVALRDASAGSKDGQKHFQINIGTTRKGKNTPFNLWYEKLIKNPKMKIGIYSWPVFPQNKVDLEKSLLTQNLTPIVSWHSLEDLEDKRVENINTFMEEYMGMLVDADTQLYPTDKIINCGREELEVKIPTKPGNYVGACDIAYVNDYFVISVFEILEDGVYKQQYLYYKKKIEAEEMEEIVFNFLRNWALLGLKKFRIDGNGPGFHIAEKAFKMFPHIVEIIRNPSIRRAGQTISFNEFIHTNQLKLINKGQLQLIVDDLQIMHYTVWNVEYKADSTKEYGHGDIAITNAYALLPINWKGGIDEVKIGTSEEKPQEIKNELKSKIEYYRKLKKQKMQR